MVSSRAWRPGDYRLGAESLSGERSLKKLVYVHPSRFHLGEAHFVQILETLHAIALNGVECHLVGRGVVGGDFEWLFAQLGYETPKNFHGYALESLGKDGLKHRLSQKRRLGVLLRGLTQEPGSALLFRSVRSRTVLNEILRRRQAPSIFEIHALVHRDPEAEQLSQDEVLAVRSLEKSVLESVDGVIANGPLLADDAREFVERDVPMSVIPNGAPEFWTERIASPDIDLVYLGSLYPWKGLDLVLDALERLDSIGLVIAGGGDEAYVARLRSRAKQLKLEERVVFLGQVNRSESKRLLERAKIALVPLASKGLSAVRYTCPIKLFEAMRLGVPAIVASRPSVRALLEGIRVGDFDGSSGIRLNAFEDPTDLAEAISELLGSPDARHHLGHRASIIARDFSWHSRGVRVIQFIEHILDRREGFEKP